MIEITSTARNTKDGKGWVIDGQIRIETKKELIAAEMAGILAELFKANKEAFFEALGISLDCIKGDKDNE